jgi:DNA-binding response OmpR family regulator
MMNLILAVKIVLEENGLQVNTFTDPFLAFENFRKKAGMYDLLILDIKMPDMNGFELYKQIKKIDDKVKVCFLIAGEMDYKQFRKELFSALDENCYIQKPLKLKR